MNAVDLVNSVSLNHFLDLLLEKLIQKAKGANLHKCDFTVFHYDSNDTLDVPFCLSQPGRSGKSRNPEQIHVLGLYVYIHASQ